MKQLFKKFWLFLKKIKRVINMLDDTPPSRSSFLHDLQERLSVIENIQRYSIDITKLPPAHGKMHILQEGNYHLMSLFDKLCKEHNIEYILFGGSLLGAVRHKGFIPWDDDLDTYMSYNDLKKLMNICENHPSYKIVYNINCFTGEYVSKFYLRNYGHENYCVDIFTYIYMNIHSDSELESIENKYKECKLELRQIPMLPSDKETIPYPSTELFQQFQKTYHDILIKYMGEISMSGNYLVRNFTEVDWKICFAFKKDEYFPLVPVHFGDQVYNAPNQYLSFLEQYYQEDIFAFPKVFHNHLDEKTKSYLQEFKVIQQLRDNQ